MTSRERVQAALEHRCTDRVPVDFGGTAVTGMHVSALNRLRQAVTGDAGHRVKVVEPYQMLGEVDPELRQRLGIDVVGLIPRRTLFGFENEGWKPFRLFDGTKVLVPGAFNVRADATGDLLLYPEGDTAAPASGRMPRDGHFFDTIVRQAPIDESRLDPADNLEEFGPFDTELLSWYEARIRDLYETTDCGIILTMPGTAFGDIALVPAPWLKAPRGIRDIEEWYVSTVTRREYVWRVFERQCAIALENLAALSRVLGDRVQAVFLTGTDFGTQRCPFISTATYRELYKPFHVQVNRFIHQNCKWKTFIHSCGAVYELIPEFIDAGFDILNPVQCSAEGMDPRRLKREFGQDLVFWGGGVETQRTMAFGTPEEVYREVRERLDIFGEDGGFVFDAVHNVQATTPTENLLAMFRALRAAAAAG